VLVDTDRLGIPDLLRREEGSSAFGEFHYVVGDVKSSALPRSDQVLQVAFYSRLLGKLQRCEPAYGFLVLKDGREERFHPADFLPALQQVEDEIGGIRAAPDAVRPYFCRACDGCRWSMLCVPELEAADDLSLLPGVTPALRQTLEAAGVVSCEVLAEAALDRLHRRTRLEGALLRRLQQGALARRAGRPLAERRADIGPLDPAAFVHFLTDPFAERVLWMGVLGPDGEVRHGLPATRADEWDVFLGLVEALPRDSRLLHYGEGVPRWHDDRAHGRDATLAVERRFVDFARRLRGAATFPGPVFGLADHVRYGLGVDPHRAGRAAAAALRAQRGETDWLRQKGACDLTDLARLKLLFLGRDHAAEPVARQLADP
jgi:predicted RecB family nuclease